MRESPSVWMSLDPVLVGLVGFLCLLGVVMVYSASVGTASAEFGRSTHFLWRQAINLLVALVAAVAIVRMRLDVWREAGPYLLLLGFVLLLLVLIPHVGERLNGSARWLNLRVVSIQPSEFMKLFMLVYVAGYLTRRRDELQDFVRGIVMIGLVLGVVGMLLLKEPDLGTTVVIVGTVLGMMFLAGVSVWHFVALAVAGIGSMSLLTVISPYRLGRVLSFLHPWANAYGSAFQLTQSLIAFGRGGVTGVGLGLSLQKLFYLPDAHTDFLFAIVGEELGLIGVAVVIIVYAVIVYRAFCIAVAAEQGGDYFGARLAEGLGLFLSLQAMVHMGVDMGVLPTKGLTLPFMSYGGSSMLLDAIAIALLLRVDLETRRVVS